MTDRRRKIYNMFDESYMRVIDEIDASGIHLDVLKLLLADPRRLFNEQVLSALNKVGAKGNERSPD